MASKQQSSTSSSSSLPLFDVTLAIYDLSRGMARSLSAQFLGGPQYAVPAIPHTGIVVYGQEYFFGGSAASASSIQAVDPHMFRRSTGMAPMELLSLGQTSVTRREFEQWCQRQQQQQQQQHGGSGRYHASSYDLLHCNCNHFCHDAALYGLRLPRGVPQWVLDVPQTFLSSPMGQIVSPLLENMQLSNSASVGAGAHAVVGTTTASSSTTTTTTAPAPITNSNPWATTTTTTAKDKLTSLQMKKKNGNESSNTSPRLSLLDSFTKPLLSTDTKMVPLCVNKLLLILSNDNNNDDDNDKKKDQLQQAACHLQRNNNNDSYFLEADLAEDTCRILLEHCFRAGARVAFGLLFLRILVLKISPSSTSVSDCLSWILEQLSSDNKKESLVSSPVARSAAWLTVSNAFGRSSALPFFLLSNNNNNNYTTTLESFVDVAVGDISHVSQPRSEVRQAACSFLYNVALVKGRKINKSSNGTENDDDDSLDDLLVSLLCSAMEGIDTEPDATCRLRRLLVIGRILKPAVASADDDESSIAKNGKNGSNSGPSNIRTSAKGLALDLGFRESLQHIVAMPTATDNNAESNCQTLALELLQIVEE